MGVRVGAGTDRSRIRRSFYCSHPCEDLEKSWDAVDYCKTLASEAGCSATDGRRWTKKGAQVGRIRAFGGRQGTADGIDASTEDVDLILETFVLDGESL